MKIIKEELSETSIYYEDDLAVLSAYRDAVNSNVLAERKLELLRLEVGRVKDSKIFNIKTYRAGVCWCDTKGSYYDLFIDFIKNFWYFLKEEVGCNNVIIRSPLTLELDFENSILYIRTRLAITNLTEEKFKEFTNEK